MKFSAYLQEQVKNLLNDGLTGKIILVNSSGIYIRFEAKILFICDISWGAVPNGILVSCFSAMLKEFEPKEGQSVIYNNDKFIFANGIIRLLTYKVSAVSSGGMPVTEYISQAAFGIVSLRKTNGLSMLVEPLVLGWNANIAEQTNLYCAKAYPYFTQLINALMHNEKNKVNNCVINLLGLGVGLTPSADDVMIGMLYVFHKLRHRLSEAVLSFSDSVLELCDSRTNSISSGFLKAVIGGAYFERMEQVWNGLCGKEQLNISRLTEIGNNSGTEMLLGMLIALRICGYAVMT